MKKKPDTQRHIIAQLNGAIMFSKIDMNAGYHQVLLAPKSRYITVFSTHVGLYRYKRLSFGVCSAAEKFQNMIQSALGGLNGVVNISDDILVFGKTEAEHANNLKACMQRLRDKNLTLNRAKCEFFRRSIEFYGHVFSDTGVAPDPKKIAAIAKAVAPATKEEVRSLLGMTQYVARFIPHYATITTPLRQLTHKDTPRNWGEVEQQAFEKLKSMLTSSHVMAYFNPEKRVHDKSRRKS